MGSTVIGTALRDPGKKDGYNVPSLREDKSGNIFYFLTQDQCILLVGIENKTRKKGEVLVNVDIMNTTFFEGEVRLVNFDEDD